MMEFLPFAEMMRRIKFVKAGPDTIQFAEDVIMHVIRQGGVAAPLHAEQDNMKAAANQASATLDNAKGVDSGFKFGAGSIKEQAGVHPILLQVANRAIQISLQDMVFFDGVRTFKEQQANLAKGVTRTMNSKHLPQADGFAHAMDLVPYINGRPTWDWDGCYRIACAVDQAATELGVAHLIRWGGAWDRTLADFGGDASAYAREVVQYRTRHPGKDFIDGPHFELVS